LHMGSATFWLVKNFRCYVGLRIVITSNIAPWFYCSVVEKSWSGRMHINVVRAHSFGAVAIRLGGQKITQFYLD
jgi:hypothetical protein